MVAAVVHPAGPLDAEVLADLELQVWQQAYAGLLPAAVLATPVTDLAERWAGRLAGGPVLLASEGGTAVGFAAVDPDRAEIEALSVVPRWSRRGHGGRLLAAAAEQLRATGSGTGSWWAPEADHTIAAFLAGAGWRPDGGRRAFDTGESTLVEVRYSGSLDLVAL
jgi:GNAT superfamily N-acetyltransferase